MVKIYGMIEHITDNTFLFTVKVAGKTIFFDFVSKYEPSHQFSQIKVELYHTGEVESSETVYVDVLKLP